jgi:hypothetical protein
MYKYPVIKNDYTKSLLVGGSETIGAMVICGSLYWKYLVCMRVIAIYLHQPPPALSNHYALKDYSQRVYREAGFKKKQTAYSRIFKQLYLRQKYLLQTAFCSYSLNNNKQHIN